MKALIPGSFFWLFLCNFTAKTTPLILSLMPKNEFCLTCGKQTDDNRKYCSKDCYVRFTNFKRYHKNLSTQEISEILKSQQPRETCKFCGRTLKHIKNNSDWCERNCYRMFAYYSEEKKLNTEQIQAIGRNKIHKCRLCKTVLSPQMVMEFGYYCCSWHKEFFESQKQTGETITQARKNYRKILRADKKQ